MLTLASKPCTHSDLVKAPAWPAHTWVFLQTRGRWGQSVSRDGASSSTAGTDPVVIMRAGRALGGAGQGAVGADQATRCGRPQYNSRGAGAGKSREKHFVAGAAGSPSCL